MSFYAKKVLNLPIMNNHQTLGVVSDLLFDSSDWLLSHYVLDTRKQLGEGVYLLPPSTIKCVQPCDAGEVSVSINQSDLQLLREPEELKSVSQVMKEKTAAAYYWPEIAADILRSTTSEELNAEIKASISSTLWSTTEILGYTLEKKNKTVGTLVDVIFSDCDACLLSAFVIDTSGIFSSENKTFLDPTEIFAIDWQNRTIKIGGKPRPLSEDRTHV